jgi:disulfide bond formation protein DsbB
MPVDVEAAEIFTAVLSLAALGGAVLLVVARLLSSRVAIAREAGSAVAGAAPWLAFLVAAGATVGSLYFSEVANYVPCRLCWFQRTAMYPL